MLTQPSGRNGRMATAIRELKRGIAYAADPNIREAVMGLGRRARDYVSSGSAPAPTTTVPPKSFGSSRRQKRAAPRPAPSRRRTRINRPAGVRNAPGLNPAVSYERPAGSKPYRTGLCREKIQDIKGSVGYTVQAELVINPGNRTMFPLGSQLAALHEQFEVKKGYINLVYETESYTAVSSNVTAGVVVMGTNVDPNDPAPLDLSEAENMYGMSRCTPYTPRCVHRVPLRHTALKTLYVNFADNSLSPESAGNQAKFYDLGIFRLATANNGTTATIGELWVEYDITLIRRKNPTSASGTRYLHLTEYPNATATAAAPGGTTGFGFYVGTTSNIAYSSTATSVTINEVGRYVLSYVAAAANIGAEPTATFGAAMGNNAILLDNTAAVVAGFQVNVKGLLTYTFEVYNITGTAASRTITFGGLTGMTGGKTDILITKIGYGVNLDDVTRVSRLNTSVDSAITHSADKLIAREKHLSMMIDKLDARTHSLTERLRQTESKVDHEWVDAQ